MQSERRSPNATRSFLTWSSTNGIRRAALLALVSVGCEKAIFVGQPGDVERDRAAKISYAVLGDPLADGFSLLQLRLILSGTPSPSRVATVTTTAGSFLPAIAQSTTVAFGTDSSAVLLLRAPRNAGLCVIRASVGGVVFADTIRYRSALPESVLLQPRDSFAIRGDASGQIVLVATLRRSTGLVSPGTAVIFTDSLQSSRAGVFGVATTSDDNGNAEVRYAPFVTDTSSSAPRKLFACTQSNGGSICGSTTIFVRKLP